VLNTSSLPQIYWNVPYTATIDAYDSSGAMLDLTVSTLPSGLSLKNCQRYTSVKTRKSIISCTLSGIPATADLNWVDSGIFTTEITVSNGKGSITKELKVPFWTVSTTIPTPVPSYPPTPTPSPSPTPNVNPPICTESSIPPATGVAPLTVTLFGSGNAGNGTGFDGYQWDFENNGSWDTAIDINPVTHTYTTPGIYNPVYRIHGTNGIWSVICKYPYQITVLKPTPKPGCGVTCQGPDSSTTVCPTGLICYQPPMLPCPPGTACVQVMPAKICRNPSCPTNTNCVCGTPAPTPRPTPTPIIRPTPTPQPICRLQFLGICLIR